jgi:hypothetical protein
MSAEEPAVVAAAEALLRGEEPTTPRATEFAILPADFDPNAPSVAALNDAVPLVHLTAVQPSTSALESDASHVFAGVGAFGTVAAAPVGIICPACESVVDLSVHVSLHGTGGDFSISARVDTDAMWAHYESRHMAGTGDAS